MRELNVVGGLKECRGCLKGTWRWVSSQSIVGHSVGRPRDVAPADRHWGGTLAGTCASTLGIASSEGEA